MRILLFSLNNQKSIDKYFKIGYNEPILNKTNGDEVMATKFLGFGVDIFSTELNGKNYPYEMYIYEVHSDGLTLPVRYYNMGEDDMELVTGLPFSEIEKMTDFQLARLIAQNSEPYGITGSDNDFPFVCEFWSTGINHYSDIKPSQEVPNEL